MEFAKGHGTGNDFVVIPDLTGALALSDAFVTAVCDRRSGIGGDGLLRIVPTAEVPDMKEFATEAQWFMDYRNADGSVAEMCGNGVRVYARWLQQAGRIGPGLLPLATRNGIRTVTVPADAAGDITVDMGAPQLSGGTRQVSVDGWQGTGLEVSMGNPHVVVEVQDLADAGRLREAPLLAPAGDANVEFVVVVGADHLAMRVHERGVGETQSCGTGACAAAVAAALWAGRDRASYAVDVPGGRLVVDWTHETVLLTGPAEIVGHGQLESAWLAAFSS